MREIEIREPKVRFIGDGTKAAVVGKYDGGEVTVEFASSYLPKLHMVVGSAAINIETEDHISAPIIGYTMLGNEQVTVSCAPDHARALERELVAALHQF